MRSIAKLINDKLEHNFNTWNSKDCRGYLQYYKINLDPKLPTKVAELQTCCCVICDEKWEPQPVPLIVAEEEEPDDDLSFGYL